jgi:hypothetical protein
MDFVGLEGERLKCLYLIRILCFFNMKIKHERFEEGSTCHNLKLDQAGEIHFLCGLNVD